MTPGISGAALAAVRGGDTAIGVAAGLSAIAVVTVEPLAARLWYLPKRPRARYP